MTLRDLLRTTSYHAIFNCIYKEYYYNDPDEEVTEMSLAYRRVRDTLLNYDPCQNKEYEIMIRAVEEEPTASFVDVCLYCLEDEETYAMDLTSWGDIIDAKIKNDLKERTDSELLAHILWEITFYGFTGIR